MNATVSAEEICRWALELPQVTKDLKWNSKLCFLLEGRIFLTVDLDAVPPRVVFKSEPEECAQLLELPSVKQAPYLGRYHWLQGESPHVWDESTWRKMTRQSYRRVVAGFPP
ncbi:MAG: MmcQ/YjbR family DNA-binding protein [Flavobacteriales bacterium]|nr:MmcQ/YjbR family DNA-binding protein [Flavobacteriales bacterium]MCX7768701.1 MmcQ/YjbR family DNA-binding protein [Flavobacteriales bacterium]MDW8410100.1 MmcQ/YjbR family DNA-binding protein [Flavobacteriales bacterium]